ncbi:MAG: mechanosensitive ion channel protein MscS [Ignavibacteriales bacterium CG_4_9_14_3_um_filter_30_11]|nr:MAG: mechanosensitive ion channel protein MscS [Ignavibacteriales bacterium CG_4_9_14_3_um_filter_30_11]
MSNFLDQTFFNNTVEKYLITIGIFILAVLLITILKKIILSRLKKWSEKTETGFNNFLIRELERSLMPVIYFWSFLFSFKILYITEKVSNVINTISIAVTAIIFIKIIVSIFKYSFSAYLTRKNYAPERRKQLKGITSIASFLIWTIGVFFLLDNLGFNISTIIAGLGVGGIAIALAAQTVLGDLFSYFVIFFDRPFEIGDFIVVGDKKGNIEYIGIKTTKVRAIDGELLIFRNTDLTDSRIHNFKKMDRRRILFKLGVVYQTKSEVLKEIPQIVKKIIDDQESATFDRGHFFSYGDSSLNFEFVYYVESSDYVKYMDIQQSINLTVFEEFEKRRIEFAYPTQTVFVQK